MKTRRKTAGEIWGMMLCQPAGGWLLGLVGCLALHPCIWPVGSCWNRRALMGTKSRFLGPVSLHSPSTAAASIPRGSSPFCIAPFAAAFFPHTSHRGEGEGWAVSRWKRMWHCRGSESTAPFSVSTFWEAHITRSCSRRAL